MEEMKFKLPVKAYTFGTTWQIRDRQNRTVLQFMPLSGDIQYKANMFKVTEWITKLINANAIDIPNVKQIVQEVDQTVPEVKQTVPEVAPTIQDVVSKVEEPQPVVEPKKQRGRHRKNG